ncbi:hypothetical protein NW754_016543 [Fusarium falciforme]|uniref:Uncharacterized protein n=1 Tax=Fusarium falciforme TaxID=195108 RepID=A0A9W8R1Z9_9HYPO|nr:Hypothetical protein NCS54_00114800 [Fusarium falciforme]KAJ4169514.1 hypothetical protein NW754_016543 [Fusarium falciforme]KAJ4184164.1 hypothetical protein NW755_009170 [Fusarium falciforme]KAJ4259490.1 hypothetical protein NW757_002812 [Fusarium falciforme]WAO83947.1 Hypothetical protein NCS54_00114800 [Fusarium falciforme]
MLSFVNYTPRTHPEHKNKDHCRVPSTPTAAIPRTMPTETPAVESKPAVPRSVPSTTTS